MSKSAAARLMSTQDSAKGFDPSKAGARAGTQDSDGTSERAGGASASGQGVEEHRVEGPETSASLTERVEAIETGQEEIRDGLKKVRLKSRKQGVKFMKAVNHLEKTISDKTNELKDAIFELKETVIEDRSASERRDNELKETILELKETVIEDRSASERRDSELKEAILELKDAVIALKGMIATHVVEIKKDNRRFFLFSVLAYGTLLAGIGGIVYAILRDHI